MGDKQETVWQRAWRDTTRSYQTVGFIWFLNILSAIGGLVAGLFFTPPEASALGPLIGTIIALSMANVLIFVYMFMRAPFQQRNEARQEKTTLVVELGQRVAELEEKHPNIKVTPVNELSGHMFLEVTNIGERGDFEAQIEVIEGRECIHGIIRPLLPTYKGYWQLTGGPCASLPQGHTDRLVIGSLEVSPRIAAANLKMSFYASS